MALTASALAVGLTACGNTPVGSTSTAEAKSNDIGLSILGLSTPSQVAYIKLLAEQGRQDGLHILPATNANSDAAKQVTDINTLLSRGISGLIVTPVDSDAVVPALESATKSKVPVVSVDTAPSGGHVYMIVRTDNYAMGVSACEAMGQRIGGTGTVLNLQGGLSLVNGRDRSQGFTDCMAKKYPKVTVISRPTDWMPSKASNATQAVLSTKDVAGVYEASDSVMGPAVENVLKNLGKWKPVGHKDHVALITIDGSGPALENIRAGYQDALLAQPQNLYAKYASLYIKDALDGKTPKLGPTDHDSTIVTYHGSMMDKLTAPLITKKNAADPSLWGNQS